MARAEYEHIEEDRGGLTWRDGPWTIKAYLWVFVVSSLFSLLFQRRDVELALLVLGLVLSFALYVWPILRGSRIGWALITILTLISPLFLFASETTVELASGIVWFVLNSVLLLHRKTQRWCRVRLW